jgi:uncharacterized membrane protein YidH (DUF202 family)
MVSDSALRFEKGTRIRVRELRRALLGPFVGLLIVDFEEQLEELHADTVERLAAEGVDVVGLPSYDRGEWLGVFDFEVEIVVEIVGFHAAKGRTEEEVQLAGWHVVVVALAIAVAAVATWYTVDRTWDGLDRVLDLVPDVFPIVAIALGFLAIALLAREIRKAKALTT